MAVTAEQLPPRPDTHTSRRLPLPTAPSSCHGPSRPTLPSPPHAQQPHKKLLLAPHRHRPWRPEPVRLAAVQPQQRLATYATRPCLQKRLPAVQRALPHPHLQQLPPTMQLVCARPRTFRDYAARAAAGETAHVPRVRRTADAACTAIQTRTTASTTPATAATAAAPAGAVGAAAATAATTATTARALHRQAIVTRVAVPVDNLQDPTGPIHRHSG